MNDLKNLDWQDIIKNLQRLATADLSRDHLSRLAPLPSPEDALQSFNEITEAEQILNLGDRPHFESLDLFSHWFMRLEKKSPLKPLELKDVRRFCLEAIVLSDMLSKIDSQWLKTLAESMIDASRPLSAIDSIMTSSGDIRSDASETLYRLYREKENLARTLQNSLDRISKDFHLETILQERYVTTREGRWVLPVRSGRQHDFGGIIHASSQSKQTVFMEPEEVIPINNRLRQVEIEIEEEVERLLVQLSNYLRSHLDDFKLTRETMQLMDIRLAEAQFALKLDAHPCQFDNEKFILNSVRHPLLVLNQENVVANTVSLSLDDKRILLLSGPNAGGKTVLLKSIGLAAQMARCGLLICTETGSRLPFYKTLIVSVGDSQSVDAQLSTFAAHLNILDQATSAKGSDYLLLIDEICGSTDPEEGSALARSFINQYAENQVFGVITSHLGPLKSGWDESSGVTNGSLEYDANRGRPTYQFLMGVSGQSLALQTAKRIGISPQIIERALGFLSPEMKARYNGLEEIETMKHEIRAYRDDLEKQKKESRKIQEKYEALLSSFENEREQKMEKLVNKAEREIKEMIQNAKVEGVFKKHEMLEKIKSTMPTIIKASANTRTPLGPPENPEEFSKRYPPGSKIFVPSLGQDGIIQGIANARGEVPVLSHSMRLTLSWKDLKPPQGASNPTAKILRQSQTNFSVALQEPQRTIDLRGMSVEDSLEQLENFLDQVILQQEDRIKIIHGHGTDTLKRAIRNYLSRSLYVKKWQAGNQDTGGDGVTWVELADDK